MILRFSLTVMRGAKRIRSTATGSWFNGLFQILLVSDRQCAISKLGGSWSNNSEVSWLGGVASPKRCQTGVLSLRSAGNGMNIFSAGKIFFSSNSLRAGRLGKKISSAL